MYESIDKLLSQMTAADDPEAYVPSAETCDILRRVSCVLSALLREMYRIQEAIEPQLKEHDAEVAKLLEGGSSSQTGKDLSLNPKGPTFAYKRL